LKIIGRYDIVDLPALGLEDIPAKVDTGAYGNALHSHEIEVVIRDEGESVLRFKVLDPSHHNYKESYFYSNNFYRKKVKSSSGQSELRYVIRTNIRLFGKTYKTYFSLANRQPMRYPILIGRKFLSGKFLVDVKSYNLSHKYKLDHK